MRGGVERSVDPPSGTEATSPFVAPSPWLTVQANSVAIFGKEARSHSCRLSAFSVSPRVLDRVLGAAPLTSCKGQRCNLLFGGWRGGCLWDSCGPNMLNLPPKVVLAEIMQRQRERKSTSGPGGL